MNKTKKIIIFFVIFLLFLIGITYYFIQKYNINSEIELKKNKELIESLPKEEKKDYTKEAIKNYDPTFCDFLDGSEVENCEKQFKELEDKIKYYSDEAVKNMDLTLCDNLINEGKNICLKIFYTEKAKQEGNIEICKKLDTKDVGYCELGVFIKKGIENKSIDICNKLVK